MKKEIIKVKMIIYSIENCVIDLMMALFLKYLEIAIIEILIIL